MAEHILKTMGSSPVKWLQLLLLTWVSLTVSHICCARRVGAASPNQESHDLWSCIWLFPLLGCICCCCLAGFKQGLGMQQLYWSLFFWRFINTLLISMRPRGGLLALSAAISKLVSAPLSLCWHLRKGFFSFFLRHKAETWVNVGVSVQQAWEGRLSQCGDGGGRTYQSPLCPVASQGESAQEGVYWVLELQPRMPQGSIFIRYIIIMTIIVI